MAKIKFTKGELKKQRDALSQFRHYLPTLQLKKQQLQVKISEARNVFSQLESKLKILEEKIKKWAGLLTEESVDLKQHIEPTKIETEETNIAGATIPVFKGVDFKTADYDYYETPMWVDRAIEQLREMVKLLIEMKIVEQQIKILQKELRVTTQRVNLFEKIKIPECIENIRRIRIYLGDQQANAVGIGKVAKGKIEARELEDAIL
jgi:V/A-type H+-transporting ATPase subunit D